MGEARRRGTFEERRAQAIEQKRRRIQAAQIMALAAGMGVDL